MLTPRRRERAPHGRFLLKGGVRACANEYTRPSPIPSDSPCYRGYWDATTYVEKVGGQAAANEAWSDNYDEAAKQERLLKPHGQDAPVLMRKLMPSAEFAGDLLPLCSGPDSATYRIYMPGNEIRLTM